MRLSLQLRLVLGSLVVLTITGLLSGIWLEGRLRHTMQAQHEQELKRLNDVVVQYLVAAGGLEAGTEVDAIVDAVGDSIQRRVTVIDSTGTVVGDSALDGERLKRMDNHANRPEIRAARLRPGDRGISRRYSGTIRVQMLYVAQTATDHPSAPVVRVSMPLETIEDAVAGLRAAVIMAGLLAAGLCILLTLVAARVYGSRLDRIAARMRANLSSRYPEPKGGIDGLVQSMDRIGQDIESLVDTLIQERDRFLTVLETMDAAVIALDRSRTITVVNSAARVLLDLGEDPTGKPLEEVIRVPDIVELTRSDLPQTVTQIEVNLSNAGGSRIVLLRAVQQRMSGGVVMVLHDITEIKHLEAIRRDFVANVSHELRTPVSVIRANAETLLDGALDDQAAARSFTTAIHRNSERLTMLLSDLLDLARMEAGETPLNPTTVMLHHSVERAFDMLGLAAEQRGVTLHNEIPNGLQVHTDPDTFDQVLLNLIGNGIKYGQSSGGRVWVRGFGESECIRIEIIDDGPGIEQRHRDRVFERFYRVDPGRSRDMGGTGLGLAIVKHLVDLMGGTVGIRPRDGGGTIFWLTLPVG